MTMDFKTIWRGMLLKLTVDEKNVLNKFLVAHREALVRVRNQTALLTSERAEIDRLNALVQAMAQGYEAGVPAHSQTTPLPLPIDDTLPLPIDDAPAPPPESASKALYRLRTPGT